MTSQSENNFRITGPLCGKFTGHRWIPLTKGSHEELWSFLWSALNKRLSKQLIRLCFEAPSRSLWRHCNVSPHWFRSLLIRSQHQEIHCDTHWSENHVYGWIYAAADISPCSMLIYRLMGPDVISSEHACWVIKWAGIQSYWYVPALNSHLTYFTLVLRLLIRCRMH